MSILDTRVTELSRELATKYPNDAGFVECLEETIQFLESLPGRFDLTFHLQLRPEQMGADRNEVEVDPLRNLYGSLGFCVYSTAYKLRELVLDIADGLNKCKFLRVTMAARSVIEHAATLNYYYEKLKLNFRTATISAGEGRESEAIQALLENIGLLVQYAQSTRFNWGSYLREDFDDFFASFDNVEERVRQIHILTLIDKLPQTERGMRFFYSMLSDYAHPNLASHTLTIDRARLLPDGRMHFSLSSYPETKESLAIVLHAISHPMNSALSLLRGQLQVLQAELRQLGEWINSCENM